MKINDCKTIEEVIVCLREIWSKNNETYLKNLKGKLQNGNSCDLTIAMAVSKKDLAYDIIEALENVKEGIVR